MLTYYPIEHILILEVISMAKYNFTQLFGRSTDLWLLQRGALEKIIDRDYFGTTHVELLDAKTPKVQAHTVVSGKMEAVVVKALWQTRVYEDKQNPEGIFVAMASGSTASKTYHMRITRGKHSGEILVSHECPACDPSSGHASCYHIPVAMLCLEAVRGGSETREGINKIMAAGAITMTVGSEEEKELIRLMDETYYQMRWTHKMNEDFKLMDIPDREKTFRSHKGRELRLGTDVLGKAKVEKGAAKRKVENIDWSQFVVERKLTKAEEKMVPKRVFYVDRMGEEKLATTITHEKDPLMIIGPAGIGKSTLAQAVYAHMGMPMVTISANSDFDYYCSLVKSTGIKDGSTHEVESKLMIAARNGYGLLVDEIRSLKPERAMVFNSFLQDRVLELGDRTMKLHRHTRVIATANEGDEYLGAGGLDPSTEDRFVKIYLDYLDTPEETKVVAKRSGNKDNGLIRKMVEIAQKTRKQYEHGEISQPITTRNLITWAKYTDGESPKKIAQLLIVPAVAKDEEERVSLVDMIDDELAA